MQRYIDRKIFGSGRSHERHTYRYSFIS